MSAPPDDRRLDPSVLEEEREFYLRSLRDLEAERAAGDLDELDYRTLRDDYTVRAAQVVRQLSALRDGPTPRRSAEAGTTQTALDPGAGAPPGGTDPDLAVEADDAGLVPGGTGPDLKSEGSDPDLESGRAGPDLASGGPGPDLASGGPGPDLASGVPGPDLASGGPGPDLGAGTDGAGATPAGPSPWRRRIIIAVAALIVIAGVAVAVIGLSKPTESSTSRVEKLDVAAEGAFVNGQYARAVQDYEAALKISPTDVLTLTGEGEVLVEVGAAGHAQPTLELGLSRLQSAEIANPSYGPAFGARGIGFYDEGNYAAAIPQFETYESDTPRASWSPTIITALATSKKKTAAHGS